MNCTQFLIRLLKPLRRDQQGRVRTKQKKSGKRRVSLRFQILARKKRTHHAVKNTRNMRAARKRNTNTVQIRFITFLARYLAEERERELVKNSTCDPYNRADE